MVLARLLMLLVTTKPEWGEWVVQHSSIARSPPNNRMVVSIYPNNKVMIGYRYTFGPLVYSRQRDGVYETKEGGSLFCRFQDTTDQLLSIYGVGVDELSIMSRKIQEENKYRFKIVVPDTDNIFLVEDDEPSSPYYSTGCVHLVRFVRVNEPSINVPFSTFLFTQILGMVISGLVHLSFDHYLSASSSSHYPNLW